MGVGMLGRGFGVWRTAPALMVLGLVPALIVGIVFAAGIAALGLNLEGIAAAVTPFASSWEAPWRTGIRVIAGLAFVAVAILFVGSAFTTITLIVGQPFYERIWRHVEGKFGAVPEAGPSGLWRPVGRGIVDGLRMLPPTIFIGVGLFAFGLIPVVGQVLSPVFGALAGGWFLTLELTGLAFDARGASF